jgi:hypothetical protein
VLIWCLAQIHNCALEQKPLLLQTPKLLSCDGL